MSADAVDEKADGDRGEAPGELHRDGGIFADATERVVDEDQHRAQALGLPLLVLTRSI